MELLLLIIASVSEWILSPFLFVWGIIDSSLKGERKQYLKNLAIAKDQYGNAVGKYVFNTLLITKEGYAFGNNDETISSCLGKNEEKKTLTKTGKCVVFLLDLCEENHSIKSIDKTETNENN